MSSPKTIATINFKGGVGKTTITWCLADTLSLYAKHRVLMFDLDAQMSLTHAIMLNDNGILDRTFERWYLQAIEKKKTIFDALDRFAHPGQHFDFPVGFDFIYQMHDQLHFVPSVEDLYWLELVDLDRELVRNFIHRLTEKIVHSPQLPDYNYILFDCPPSFTLLSYSVLACCELILIPVNPDFFAARGTSLILNSLKMRIEPHPLPKIGVFMNKTKTYAGQPTKEASAFMSDVKRVCAEASRKNNIQARFFNSWIPERASIRRAITNGMPADFVPPFAALWQESVRYLDE